MGNTKTKIQDPDVPIDPSAGRFTQDDMKEYTQAFQLGGVKACESFLGRKANEWKTIPLNIGIIGNSGTGKSSFINAIRGLTADDEGAAQVKEIETTTTAKDYPHPNNELLKFWDLPGVGTPNFPKDDYVKKIGFDKFDFFIIICKDRFTENDLWIARQLTERKLKFFFVRSHIHDSIKNNKKAHPITHNEEAVMDEIQNNIKDNLRKEGAYREAGVFLIDNYEPALYDFKRLEQRIIDEFPSAKRDAYILSLNALSEEVVRRKVKVMRSKIWISTASSGVLGLIPIPGVSAAADITIILTHTLHTHIVSCN